MFRFIFNLPWCRKFFLKSIFSVYLNNDLDPEYRKFLESYAADNEKMTSTPETLLEEIEAKNRELIGKWATGIKDNGFFLWRLVWLLLLAFASCVTMGKALTFLRLCFFCRKMQIVPASQGYVNAFIRWGKFSVTYFNAT